MGDWIVSDEVWNENVEELDSNPSSGTRVVYLNILEEE